MPEPSIAEALRLIRIRLSLTQTAAAKHRGAPDFRTLSHWETRRKSPSLKILMRYLDSLGLDLHDFQEALDQVDGRVPKKLMLADKLLSQGIEAVLADPEFQNRIVAEVGKVDDRLAEIERRVRELEQQLERKPAAA